MLNVSTRNCFEGPDFVKHRITSCSDDQRIADERARKRIQEPSLENMNRHSLGCTARASATALGQQDASNTRGEPLFP